VLTVLIALALCPAAGAQVPLTAYGVPVAEDFNTLEAFLSSTVVPAGWAFVETGTNANGGYAANNGSNNSGDTYSYGANLAPERAFGALRSGSLVTTVGAAFANGIGGPVGRLDIEYVGEQWRLGALGRLDRWDFQYSLNATSLVTGTWTDVDALDFVAPVQAGTVGALDGNVSPNRTLVSATISGLALAPGAVIWLRWSDLDAAGADDGLAVDDFQLIPREPPVPVQAATMGGLKGAYR
jgi:hypothetical protein